MDDNSFHIEATVRYRMLLTNAEDVAELGDQAEVKTSNWYDESIPIDFAIKKAKEFNKNVVTIETHTIVERSFYVERGD